MSWRKIVVDNKEWQWKVGRRNVVIYNLDRTIKFVMPMMWDYDDNIIPITPSMVSKYIVEHYPVM